MSRKTLHAQNQGPDLEQMIGDGLRLPGQSKQPLFVYWVRNHARAADQNQAAAARRADQTGGPVS